MQAKLSPAIPQLPSGDIEKTAQFFTEFLGFEIVALFVEHKHLIVRRGPAEIHFWQADSETEAKKMGSVSSCYIRVENIELLFKEFKTKGTPFRLDMNLLSSPGGCTKCKLMIPT